MVHSEKQTLAGQWGCFSAWLPYARTNVKPPSKIVFFEKIGLGAIAGRYQGV